MMQNSGIFRFCQPANFTYTDVELLTGIVRPITVATSKIAVLTGSCPNYSDLAAFTTEMNKVEYCDRHGYYLYNVNEVRSKYRDSKSHAAGFSWSRLEEMLEMLESEQFEWVWCVGCDTLITNLTLKLEELTEATGKHLIICGERVAPLQADSFLVRSSKEGIGWVKDILSTYPEYRYHPWVENQAMIDRKDKHSAITEIVPQWRLNSYDYRRFYYLGDQYRDGTDCYGNRGQWKHGDFLIHWPASSLSQRIDFLCDYYSQIIR